MKPKKLTNAQFLKKVEELKKKKDFTYTDETEKIWTGEMAIAKSFGMTRAEYRAKVKEAKAEAAKKSSNSDPRIGTFIEKIKKLLDYGTFLYTDDGGKIIPGDGSKNGRYYVELPDGYRLIYDNDGYVGRYDPAIGESV